MFQSTHPHGVRPLDGFAIRASDWFQSTHPHGVRPLRGVSQKGWCCFNPRTHTGCDVRVERVSVEVGVSIHAPTRGATARSVSMFDPKEFQSTHPHGVRREGQRGLPLPRQVSIHAPTRGATVMAEHRSIRTAVSIHAPTRGATLRVYLYVLLRLFQSTHPHGVRRAVRERDIAPCRVSIHAPTRGATRMTGSTFKIIEFQSTHPHGVRRCGEIPGVGM